MKLTFVTSTLHAGGSERVMSLLANTFAQKGYEVEIICINKHLVFYPIDEKVKVWFAEDEVKSPSILKKVLWLRNHIKNDRPDVVIAFMLEVYCVTLASLLGIHIPVISSERVDPCCFGKAKGLLRWLLLRRTTHLVVQTERIKEFYSPKIQARTSIIKNPVTEKVFGLQPVEKVDRLIAVGRLAYQKNYPMMFRAFAQVHKLYPQYQLVVYGDGPQKEEIREEITKLGMEGHIVLAGKSDHVIDEMNRSRLFVMSSDYEGMSNALLEAICVGLPVLSTDVSGAKELIDNGKNGVVVPVGDEAAFTSALEQLFSSPEKMEEMGKYSKAKAPEFKEEKIVDQWERLIKAIVKWYVWQSRICK